MRLEPGDAAYPERLLDLSDPPREIFVQGNWPILQGAYAVAIVGARRASEESKLWTHEVAAELARHNVVVISGGALGIDAAAHRGALAGGGKTLVVLPTPIESPAPRSHRKLFDRVLEAGAWLSDARTTGGRYQFVKRNRIVAALADVVVVPEAELASGTESTVAIARLLKRPLRVRPVGLKATRGALNLDLLVAGVPAVRHAGDLLAGASIPRRPRTVTAESWAEEHKMSVGASAAHLMRLVLEGRAEDLGGGRYACE